MVKRNKMERRSIIRKVLANNPNAGPSQLVSLIARATGRRLAFNTVRKEMAEIKMENWAWISDFVKQGMLTEERDRLTTLRRVFITHKQTLASGKDRAGEPLTATKDAALTSALVTLSKEIHELQGDIAIKEVWLKDIGHPDDPDWRKIAAARLDDAKKFV